MSTKIPPTHVTLTRCLLTIVSLLVVASYHSGPQLMGQNTPTLERSENTIRFATFNCSLNRSRAGELIADLKQKEHQQIDKIVRIICEVQPDVLLLNEFDYDEGHEALHLFKERLAQATAGIRYPYSFTAPVNTGVDSGKDLDGDGRLGTANDAFGYGAFPGQYGMVVLSKSPIETQAVRTFQKFLWRDMPHALWPKLPESGQDYYSAEIKEIFRLSSKSHWDVPIKVSDNHVIHLLCAHPTPPVFDGPEDRNGCRNHDEIRLWADYVSGAGDYLIDDAGRRGGLAATARFVIVGDYNADPVDGDSRERAIHQLLDLDLLQDPQPRSAGGAEQAARQGGANLAQRGDPSLDTGDFNDNQPGNLRIDYVLPSKNQRVVGAGVFWPKTDDPLFELVDASDHRLVWVDLELPREANPARTPSDRQR